MLGRRVGSYVAKRFFSSPTFNQHALSRPLNEYVSQFRDPDDILKVLGMKEFSSKIKAKYFLEKIPFNQEKLNLSPIQLIDVPILINSSEKLLNTSDLIIDQSRQKLRDKLIKYTEMLFSVMQNEYSKRNYELALEERENVSEREHGQQAEKIARQLEMPMSYVIQERFHDISRCTHGEVEYCNKHHHKESHRILLPLRSSLSYSKFHTFGKYLLTQCCDSYKELISPFSAQSLVVQKKQFSEIIHFLHQQKPEEAVKLCFEFMLLRLIDDSSKVPNYLLKNDVHSRYYSDETTLSSVITLLNQVMQNLPISQYEQYIQDLEAAIELLHRPELQNNYRLVK